MRDDGSEPAVSGYVTVQGRRVWHELHGTTGERVVLLHGGFAGASSWGAQAPALAAAGFRVHVPERRGHAHTPDVEGPLTYAVMAQDTIDYLDAVVADRAHLVGWSDGAVVAMLVAMRRPDLVKRMVVIGQYCNSRGRVPDSSSRGPVRRNCCRCVSPSAGTRTTSGSKSASPAERAPSPCSTSCCPTTARAGGWR